MSLRQAQMLREVSEVLRSQARDSAQRRSTVGQLPKTRDFISLHMNNRLSRSKVDTV